MTKEELYNNPPWFFYLKRMQYQRGLERGWDYVRSLITASYNTAFGNKKRYTPNKIMELSFDKKDMRIELPDEETIRAMMTKWN